MIGKPFVNQEFSSAIELYLKLKDHKENPGYYGFFVVVIRTLVYIYGELDIINPYITQNEGNMGGLDNNITKFGFPKDKLQDFKQQFIEYEKEKKENAKPNHAFYKIEKYLIDMFFYKKNGTQINQEELNQIQELIYIPTNPNQIMQQELQSNLLKTDELVQYFLSKQYESTHNYNLEEIKRYTLIPEAYFLLGYNINQINNMTDQDLNAVNKQVFDFFKVDYNAENRDEMLGKAVNYYKRYGNRITSGNGYVDLLLFLSIIATTIFIVTLFVYNFL